MSQNDDTERDINIPDVPEPIIEAASKGNLVIFVGAAVSGIIGCPSWGDFANKFLDDLFERDFINFFERNELSKLHPRKILSICVEIYKEKELSPPDFKEILKEDPELKEKYNVYENLYDFNAIYVTTNYDDLLDREALKGRPVDEPGISEDPPQGSVINNIRKGKVFYEEEELLSSNLENGNVIHIHGSVNEPSKAVLTLVDYMSQYSDLELRAPVLLREIFNQYTVLFIGYGLEEYEVLEFMINRIPKSEHSISHFILIPFFKSQENVVNFQKKYYASFGIELVPYFIDESGYSHLSNIIEEWAKQIGPISSFQTPLDKLRLVDEVLK